MAKAYLSATFSSQHFRLFWFIPSSGILSLCSYSKMIFFYRTTDNFLATTIGRLKSRPLCNKILFPQMWKHCPISVCRTPPGGPLCPHLAPLMRPEEERCSSLIVHSIKRWNGKIPSRLLYLDKKIIFLLTKKNSSTLLSCTHHMVKRIPNFNFQLTQFF